MTLALFSSPPPDDDGTHLGKAARRGCRRRRAITELRLCGWGREHGLVNGHPRGARVCGQTAWRGDAAAQRSTATAGRGAHHCARIPGTRMRRGAHSAHRSR